MKFSLMFHVSRSIQLNIIVNFNSRFYLYYMFFRGSYYVKLNLTLNLMETLNLFGAEL
jgi:hypothetical protein